MMARLLAQYPHFLHQRPVQPVENQNTVIRRNNRKPSLPLGECLNLGPVGQRDTLRQGQWRGRLQPDDKQRHDG